jgi:hypothetical protein
MVNAVSAGDLDSGVARAVVDHEPLDDVEALELPRETRERDGQRLLLVEARDLDDELQGAASIAHRLAVPLTLGGVLALALGLRVWGLRHGLPEVYNVDENAHFVPRAIGFFGHDLNPRYFVNPPAFTYLLHLVFLVRYGSGDAAGHALASDPSSVFALARLTSALLATIAVGLLYIAGKRLFGRTAGLLAAALLAFSFLPVHYSHLALNDAPALAPVALALVGVAGLLRGPVRRRDLVLAGLGAGLAAATKYTAGVVVVALVVLAVARRVPPRALALALAVAAGAFVAANPYAVLDAGAFLHGLGRQHSATASSTKLGTSQHNGFVFYGWALTWGFGIVPLIAAGGGAVVLAAGKRARLTAWVLIAPTVCFLLFMGAQDRYFGRWVMPVLPLLCLLAAAGGIAAIRVVSAWRPRLGVAFAALTIAALLAQGAVAVIHNDLVLSRADTRALTLAWMNRNIPAGAGVVVEPVVGEEFRGHWTAVDPRRPAGARGEQALLPQRRLAGLPLERIPRPAAVVGAEGYARSLRPELVGAYERAGICWVVVGSTQRGRIETEPRRVPDAVAYYRALERSSRIAFRASPFRPGARPVPFGFDHSFSAYPLAYERPGPVMTVYRLLHGRCQA